MPKLILRSYLSLNRKSGQTKRYFTFETSAFLIFKLAGGPTLGGGAGGSLGAG